MKSGYAAVFTLFVVALSVNLSCATNGEAERDAESPIRRVKQTTPGGLDQARAFAEPILSYVSKTAPDFEDDFSDPSSGWEVTDPKQAESGKVGRVGYQDGKYFMEVVPPAQTGVSFPMSEAADSVLQMDCRIVGTSAPTDGSANYDIQFRDSQREGYRVSTGNGNAGLFRRTSEGEFQALAGYGGEGEVVKKGDEVNHVQLIAKGSSICLYVNQEPCLFAHDESFRKGSCGILAFAKGNSPFRLELDNVKVWSIANLK